MSDNLIERLRAPNYPTHMDSLKLPGRCVECYQRWPCDPADSDMERAEAADRIEQLEAEINRLEDNQYLWFLRGFCSSTAEFNGNTHGHDPEQQLAMDHLDNFETYQTSTS